MKSKQFAEVCIYFILTLSFAYFILSYTKDNPLASLCFAWSLTPLFVAIAKPKK